MTIGDVVTQLKYGELRSISIKDDNAAIVSYINLALVALYSRFNLKISEVIIPLSHNIVEYKLPSDCMTVQSIFDENGDEFSLDDDANRFGIFQVDFETLQVANPGTGASIGVIYITSPISLVFTTNDDLTKIVPIPPQLLEPLLHYIGYRAHGSMDGDIKAENNTHFMRYEASCRRIEALGLIRKPIPGAHVNMAESISDSNIDYTDLTE